MTDARRKKSHGCVKGILWGCFGLLFITFLTVVLVIVNLDKIVPEDVREGFGDFIDSRKQALGYLAELNSKLAPIIEAESVNASVSFGPGDGDDHLVVNIMNPRFQDDGETEVKARAREVALFAARNYADMDSIGTVVVVLIHRTKVGVTFTRTNPYPFPVEDLLPDERGAAEGDQI